MEDIFNTLYHARERNMKTALCIITSTKGSTPRKMGAKMLVYENGIIQGTIGGGSLEKKVIEDAIGVLIKNKPETFKHDLLHHHGMCCGGSMEIYIEPIMKKNKLYIFGAGHTGTALAKYASDMYFETFLIDDRKEYLDACNVQNINKMHLPYKNALQALPFDENTYIVIATYSHPYDREILAYCIGQPHAYLGMIGSKRKVELTKKMFTEGNIATTDQLEKTDMPMGINIHAESPEEIAISILAKLIEVKNKIRN